jgi:hypothetical protein
MRVRLHKSSVVVGLLVAGLLFLIIVPGRIIHGTPSTTLTFEHGWPFNYLRREAQGRAAPTPFIMYRGWDDVAERPMFGVPWLAAANWRLWEATTDESKGDHESYRWTFDGRVLLANIAIATLVVIAAMAAWETRRRRRPRLYAFNLADLLLAGTCISGFLGWMVYLESGHRREAELDSLQFDSQQNPWFSDDESCVAPIWLRSLVGEQLLPDFMWRITSVNVIADEEHDYMQLVAQLSEFAYLERINFDGIERETDFRLRWLSKLERVKTLQFYSGMCRDQRQLNELMQLSQLQKIVLADKEEVEPRTLSALQAALPGCQIVDWYEEW